MWALSLLEWRHRQPLPLELGVVELRKLALARPHDRLARIVDRVREAHALVVVDARDRLGEGERDTIELQQFQSLPPRSLLELL